MPDFPDAVPPFVRSVRSVDADALMSDDPELAMMLGSLAEKGMALEMFTFECARCGPIYLSGPLPGQDADSLDRDSLVGSPRKPSPQVDKSAIAVPEPDDDEPQSG
jgi:hypothetical protein